MNSTEDRLRRALEARAAQVAPESLRPLVVPGQRPKRRIWAPVLLAGAAAGIAAVAVVSLLVDSAPERRDAPPVGTPERVVTGSDCPREAEPHPPRSLLRPRAEPRSASRSRSLRRR